MELHPTISEDFYDPILRRVTLVCKYQAPEPLVMKFVIEGHDYGPFKYANESILHSDGWHGELVVNLVWDTRHISPIYECHTINLRGSTLGVLTADLSNTPLFSDYYYEGRLGRRLSLNTRFVLKARMSSLCLPMLSSQSHIDVDYNLVFITL